MGTFCRGCNVMNTAEDTTASVRICVYVCDQGTREAGHLSLPSSRHLSVSIPTTFFLSHSSSVLDLLFSPPCRFLLTMWTSRFHFSNFLLKIIPAHTLRPTTSALFSARFFILSFFHLDVFMFSNYVSHLSELL